MDSSKYVAVKRKLNLRPAAWATMSIVLLDTVLFGISVLLIQTNTVFGSVASSCLLALVGFHCFGVLHECGHSSTSRNKFFNSILGHLVSPLCLLPYYPWKYIHAEHHRWTGNLDKDPTLRAIKERKQIGRFSRIHQLIWENWIPIGGMKQYTVFWAYPLTLLGREDVKRRTLIACLFSVCWLIVAWTMLLYALPVLVSLYVVLPAIVLYFVIVELVNLPHHSDQPVFPSDSKEGRLALNEQHRTTRSCYYPRLVSELLFMNFNFHIEHHLFPTMPWHRLRAARHALKDSLGNEYTETIGISWNLDNRSKHLDSVLFTERYLEENDDKTDPQTQYKVCVEWLHWRHRRRHPAVEKNTWSAERSYRGAASSGGRASHISYDSTHSGDLAA